MAATTQVTVTKTWAKLSDSDCTVQSVISSELFDIAVNTTEPIDDAHLQLRLIEPITLDYKTPVWVRLNQSAMSASTAKVDVIK